MTQIDTDEKGGDFLSVGFSDGFFSYSVDECVLTMDALYQAELPRL